jgi:opacity protein-like surface antigen
MRVFWTVLILSLPGGLWTTDAFAQAPATGGLEIFAAAGPSWMWDDEGYLGTAVAAGGGVAFRRGALGLEAVVDHRRHQPDFNNAVIFRTRQTRVMGRVLYFFGTARAQPYVGGSVGLAHVDRFSEFPDDCRFVDHVRVCDGVRRFESRDSSRALGGIGGVRVALNERWFIRPEFELAHAGNDITMGAMVAVGRSW